jgi:cytosine deaminase
MLRAAMEAGADVVGGAPHADVDPLAATRELVAMAQHYDAPIDPHTDECMNVEALSLRELLTAAAAGRPAQGTIASHCVSLGAQKPELQREIAERSPRPASRSSRCRRQTCICKRVVSGARRVAA